MSDGGESLCPGGSGEPIETGEIVTLGLANGAWAWGAVEAVDDATVTLRSIDVTDDLSTPPARGGKVGTGGRTTVQRAAIQVLVRGLLQQWE